MLAFDVPDAGITLHAPENASECTPAQYAYLLSLYPRLLSGKLSPDAFLIGLAYNFLNLKRQRKGEAVLSVPTQKHVNLWRIAKQFNGFLSYRDDGSAQLNITTIRQFYPRFKHNGKTIIGAADALTSLSFIEFIHLDVAARKYAESQDPAQLALLTALIYRQRAPWWRKLFKADAYDAQNVEIQAQKHPLPQLYQLAALNLYQSTLQWWNEGPIEINGTEVDLRLLWSNNGQSGKSKGSLTTVLFSLAESGVFGTVKQTSEANLYDVLLRLYQVAQQAKEAEQKAKEKKK